MRSSVCKQGPKRPTGGIVHDQVREEMIDVEAILKQQENVRVVELCEHTCFLHKLFLSGAKVGMRQFHDNGALKGLPRFRQVHIAKGPTSDLREEKILSDVLPSVINLYHRLGSQNTERENESSPPLPYHTCSRNTSVEITFLV